MPDCVKSPVVVLVNLSRHQSLPPCLLGVKVPKKFSNYFYVGIFYIFFKEINLAVRQISLTKLWFPTTRGRRCRVPTSAAKPARRAHSFPEHQKYKKYRIKAFLFYSPMVTSLTLKTASLEQSLIFFKKKLLLDIKGKL